MIFNATKAREKREIGIEKTNCKRAYLINVLKKNIKSYVVNPKCALNYKAYRTIDTVPNGSTPTIRQPLNW